MPHKRKDLNIEGTNLWYLVGLITSDGCLSSDGRHINITAKNYKFLQGIKRLTGLKIKIGTKYGDKDKKQKAFYIQITNRGFYDFLLSIGLSPKKSLTLGAVMVPSPYFTDFLRGLIDGDGCICRWIHPSNLREQWSLRVYSGSKKFLEWVQDEIEKIIEAKGRLHAQSPTQFKLKYGKMAARIIAQKCYREDCFGLQRKVRLAKDCIDSYKGWSKSKTVFNKKEFECRDVGTR